MGGGVRELHHHTLDLQHRACYVVFNAGNFVCTQCIMTGGLFFFFLTLAGTCTVGFSKHCKISSPMGVDRISSGVIWLSEKERREYRPDIPSTSSSFFAGISGLIALLW
jgi:hypothetical protein